MDDRARFEEFAKLATEQRNPRTMDLDRPSTREVLERFFTSAREAIAQGIIDTLGPCMAERDVELVAELWLAMFEGLFLRHLIVDDEDQTNHVFAGMREAVMLLVKNRLPAQFLDGRSLDKWPVRSAR